MALDLVARAQPALTIEELAPILAGYPGLGAAVELAWHSPRPFAASAILRTMRAQMFVKRHDPRVRSAADLLEEHAFIAHLRANGAAVPPVLAARNGATAVTGQAGTYELHALGEGDDAYRDAHSWEPARTLADAEAIGFALGRLHRAAAGFAAPARRTHMLVAGDALIRAEDLEIALAGWIADDPRLAGALADRAWRADFCNTILAWHDAARPHRPAMAPLWTHGDFHASNLLWRGGAVSAVLDFGLANCASAVFDLATAIERNAIGWLRLSLTCADIGRADLACALLRGYDAARPRPGSEMRALRHVLPIVHLDFALSELVYFHAVTECRQDEEAAYSDFLLGHSAWFATADGRRFLDGISLF